MSVSEHANYLLNEFGRLQFDYAAFCKPDGESLRNEARNNLEEYIAELEAKKDILVDQLREATKSLIEKKIDVDYLYEYGFKLQKRIAELREDNASLGDSNAWIKQNYEDLERDYGVMHEKMCARIDKLKGAIEILEDQQREAKNILIDKNLHIDSLYEEGYKLQQRIAELEEQVWNLNLENERLEEAYWIDETISPDGTLKPSVRKLLERLEKAETDLRLSDDLVKALDNRIAKLEADKELLNSCESALISMVNQFFYSEDGENIFRHSFMSAEEEAAEYLVEHGIARWVGKNKSAICFNEVQE